VEVNTSTNVTAGIQVNISTLDKCPKTFYLSTHQEQYRIAGWLSIVLN
jgi:hypothetical protein